jgi:hypothetical protein
MKASEKLALITELVNNLETHDKAWMFLKCSFPYQLGDIQLEGTPKKRAWNILFILRKAICLVLLLPV